MNVGVYTLAHRPAHLGWEDPRSTAPNRRSTALNGITANPRGR